MTSSSWSSKGTLLLSSLLPSCKTLKIAQMEVLRGEEFAPVKTANGASYDTPETARLMLLRLHSRWVVAAGGFLTYSVPLYLTGVEISPLCSYAGENLEAICRGRTFHAPCEIITWMEKLPYTG